MRNIFLVARRELMENMRTKGFWIGILSFPILLAAGIFLPVLFMKSKAVRTFAVVDESGWLAATVEQRACAEDLAWLFDAAAGRAAFQRPD